MADTQLGHKLHECNDPTCFVCNGGLALCEICKGAEATLPTDCPGIAMDHKQRDEVQDRTLDYVSGKWIKMEHGK